MGAGRKGKVCLVSLGCSKNLVDSEVMLGVLHSSGFELTEKEGDAEVLIVNTCGFIGDAKAESVEEILRLAEYKKKGSCSRLIVAGCLTQRYKEELLKELPEVDYFIGTGEFPRIGEILENLPEERVFVNIPKYVYQSDTPRLLSTPKHFAYVKVAEGCSNLCTYCAIPAIRGSFRSRPIDSIVKEAEILAAQGAREINLIAQDTTSFGVDLGDRKLLVKLLKNLTRVSGIEWIRPLYLYPGRIEDDVLKLMRDEEKILPYIDLPVQHIATRVLQAMNRHYGRKEVLSFIERARKEVPGVTLRTTVIVGFPGETEREFSELVSFIEEARFDRLGAFKYSREEGTPAFGMKGQVSRKVKGERRERVMEVQREISLEKNLTLVGKTVKVLVEGFSTDFGAVIGRSSAQAPEVDGVTLIEKADGLRPGDIIDLTITRAEEYDLAGEAARSPV